MLLVVSGASGTGKSTVCAQVRRNMPELGFSVSCTTRPPRPQEKNAVDYYFISRDEFKTRIEAGDFIEYAEVFNNYYGTLKSEVSEQVKNGRDILLDIDVQGAMQIRQAALSDPGLAKCSEFIFIAPPSFPELEKRLRGRKSDPETQIRQRLAKAGKEISSWRKYTYLIVNDKSENAAADMENLIRALRLSSKRMPEDMFKWTQKNV